MRRWAESKGIPQFAGEASRRTSGIGFRAGSDSEGKGTGQKGIWGWGNRERDGIRGMGLRDQGVFLGFGETVGGTFRLRDLVA